MGQDKIMKKNDKKLKKSKNVFLVCKPGDHLFPSTKWDREKNDKYVYGSAGSLLMECPICKKCHYRESINVLHFQHKEYCVWCSDIELVPVLDQTT